MITGVWNGYNIVAVPSTPSPKTIDFTLSDTVGVSTSPFTQQLQTNDWQASWMEASVQLPPMQQAAAQTWIAWLMQLRGLAAVFQMGDPLGTIPAGAASGGAGVVGTPVVSGNINAGYSLLTRNWTPSLIGVLFPGDWLQVGVRIYRVLDIVNTDASGNASIDIWPQIRETPTDGEAIVLTNTVGLWRLSNNARKFSMVEGQIYGFQFEMKEAL